MRARKMLTILLVVLFVLSAGRPLLAKTNELRYASRLGSADLLTQVDHLDSTKRVLYVGAHPDDENNATLVYLNRHEGAEVFLDTTNWGEGGENAIGSEFGPALGALRSQESRSARQFDLATQLYGQTYDFGYSVSLNESLLGDEATNTEAIWNRDLMTYDLARIIREIRPQVIFTSHRSPDFNHGQHIAVGFVTVTAIGLAADPDYVITGQDGEALPSYQVKKLFTPPYSDFAYEKTKDRLGDDMAYVGIQSAEDPRQADLTLELGTYDPYLGMSYAEWGIVGRNMHKSQKMTHAPSPLSMLSAQALKYASPDLDPADEAVSGTIYGGLEEEASLLTYDPQYTEALTAVTDLIQSIQNGFDATQPALSTKPVAELIQALTDLEAQYESDEEAYDFLKDLALVRNKAQALLADLLGLEIEVLVDDSDVTPGQTFTLTANVMVRDNPDGLVDVSILENQINLELRDGWTSEVKETNALTLGDEVVGLQEIIEVTAGVDDRDYTGPFNAPYDEAWTNEFYRYGAVEGGSEPLKNESQDGAKHLEDSLEVQAPEEKLQHGITTNGLDPYAHAPLAVEVHLPVDNHPLDYVVEPELRLVPEISLTVQNASLMLQATGEELQSSIEVLVRNNTPEGFESIKLTAAIEDQPEGFSFSEEEISLTGEGQAQLVRLNSVIPADFKDESVAIHVTAEADGRSFTDGFTPIAYDHTAMVNFYEDAVQNLTVQDYKIASDDLRIGFYAGGSDDFVVPYIRGMYSDRQMGEKNVQILSGDDIAQSGKTLAERYDTIIIGKTAITDYSAAHEALRSSIQNLLDFANAGGNLVVHYQNYTNDQGMMPLAPVPFPLGTTNINNENADVFIDDAALENPLYKGVNDIDLMMEDGISKAPVFDGWIQQRTEWTPGTNDDGQVEAMEELGYTVLFRAEDPESTMRPAILYMEMENGGHFTYSAVVWDRQLDNLVPGAYTLYANLISMGYDEGAAE